MFLAGASGGNRMQLSDSPRTAFAVRPARFSPRMAQTSLRRALAILQPEISRPAVGGSSSLFSRDCYAAAMDARVQQHQRIKGN
jgi:hypothetical protein